MKPTRGRGLHIKQCDEWRVDLLDLREEPRRHLDELRRGEIRRPHAVALEQAREEAERFRGQPSGFGPGSRIIEPPLDTIPPPEPAPEIEVVVVEEDMPDTLKWAADLPNIC